MEPRHTDVSPAGISEGRHTRVLMTGSARLRGTLGADWPTAYAFVLPLAILIGVLVVYPFIYSLYLSFTVKQVGVPAQFIGLRNYIRLAGDQRFWRAAYNTVMFTVGAVGLKLILGLVMALTLFSDIKGRDVWTALLLIPWVTPGVIASLNWMWMYDALSGIINYMLLKSHLISMPIAWLGERGTAMPAVIVTNVWRGFTFYGVTLLAAMQTIPRDLFEAADIEGANAWQRLRWVILPHLNNTIIIVTMLSFLWTFNDFQQIWIMTRGGPGGATETLAVLSYQIAFGALRLGEAVTISIYLFPLFTVVILLLARRIQRGQQVQ